MYCNKGTLMVTLVAIAVLVEILHVVLILKRVSLAEYIQRIRSSKIIGL